MDLFDWWDRHPVSFGVALIAIDLLLFFSLVLGTALIVKAVFF